MGFAPLEEIEGPIVLTLRGREFTIPPLSLEDGVKLQAALAAGTLTDAELAKTLLGPALNELGEAGCTPAVISRVTAVAIADWKFGRRAAEAAWQDPKALADLVTQQLQILRAMAAAEATTQPVESTTTTTSPTAQRTKAPRSRGKKS
jgi:hypothetical protein